MSFPGAAVVAGPGGADARGATVGAELSGATVGAAGRSDDGAESVVCGAGPVCMNGAAPPDEVGTAGAWTVGAIEAGFSTGAWTGPAG